MIKTIEGAQGSGKSVIVKTCIIKLLEKQDWSLVYFTDAAILEELVITKENVDNLKNKLNTTGTMTIPDIGIEDSYDFIAIFKNNKNNKFIALISPGDEYHLIQKCLLDVFYNLAKITDKINFDDAELLIINAVRFHNNTEAAWWRKDAIEKFSKKINHSQEFIHVSDYEKLYKFLEKYSNE